MEAVGSTETVTLVYKTARHHIQRNCNRVLLDFYLNENTGIILAHMVAE
jgi:hypothetical protein